MKKHSVIMAAIGALGLALTVQAAYLEADGGVRADRVEPIPPPPRFIPPEPGPQPGAALRTLVRQVSIGDPYSRRGLTVYPLLLREQGRRREILTLDEAASRGDVVIREHEDGQVAEIRVRNDSRRPVFLLTGELILGGKQNRIVRDDVLLPPESGFIELPVYCGERDRWQSSLPVFRSGATLSAPALRQLAAGSAPQERIWGEIDSQLSRAKVESPTRSYQGVYEDREVCRELDRCVAEFRGFARRDTAGCVVTSGSRILGCELFSDPELFARLWPKILRSYAMNVVLPGRARPEPYDKRASGIWPGHPPVRRFLDQVLSAEFSTRHTPGMGWLAGLSGGVSGSVLVDGDEVVHASVFDGRYEVMPISGRNRE